ncbi:MAG: hypothetical protein GC201_18345 [Alphaproteobacteria bacterium]|nr:hypothetical protein [Alphaproteobacteria bacterium]
MLAAGVVAAAGYLAAGTAPAHAAAVAFCNKSTSKTCLTAYVQNSASVTVTSIDIDQEKGASGTCDPVRKRVDRTVLGGTDLDPGQQFRVSVDSSCEYKISFNTTKGCTGDKVAHLRKRHFDEQRNYVKMRGACGSLETTVGNGTRDQPEAKATGQSQ